MSNQSQGIYDARSLGRSKFTSLIGLIPAVTIGGVSLILYGMISVYSEKAPFPPKHLPLLNF